MTRKACESYGEPDNIDMDHEEALKLLLESGAKSKESPLKVEVR